MYERNNRTFKSDTSEINDIDMKEDTSNSSLHHNKEQILLFQQEIRKKEKSVNENIFENVYKKHFGHMVMFQIIV